MNGWDTDLCIQHFRELCHEAFTPREFKGAPVLEQLAVLNHGSMYKTRPFEDLLKERFEKDRLLFGGANDRWEMLTKVAVTSTVSVDQHAVLISNYNRPESSEFGSCSAIRSSVPPLVAR